MDIVFYQYTLNSNRLNKSLSDGYTVSNCSFNAEYDVIHPCIKIVGVDISSYNYCVINSNYYFIDSINIERNNLYVANLTLDVLMTYKDVILAQQGTVIESQNTLFLNGNEYPTYSYYNRTTIQYSFNNPFNENGEYVLISSGHTVSEV